MDFQKICVVKKIVYGSVFYGGTENKQKRGRRRLKLNKRTQNSQILHRKRNVVEQKALNKCFHGVNVLV